MHIVVVADSVLKDELVFNGVQDNSQITWINEIAELKNYNNVDAIIDLGFNNENHRIDLLKKLLPRPVVISSLITTLQELDLPFIRINGWPGFLKGPLIEASAKEEGRKNAEQVLAAFNKKTQWVKDEPGFVAARVVAMIINEAFLTWEEGVSSREEINTAMKMGTNYPYGPFEWAQKIGLEKISALLQKLHHLQPRYKPAQSLLSSVK